MFGLNIRLAFGKLLENLQKSSEKIIKNFVIIML